MFQNRTEYWCQIRETLYMMTNNKLISLLGASNHSKEERAKADYYATPPKAVEWLIHLESPFDHVLEPACGGGHISNVLVNNGIKTTSSDIYNRGYGEQKNFFHYRKWSGDIITNPPYKQPLKFAQHALKIIPKDNKVCLFLKLLFLEGKGRRNFFERHPPIRIHVASTRFSCGANGVFSIKNSAVCYAWFVWEKGYKGNPIIKWFN